MAEKTIFIPEKIKVGYRERSGTYTGKLAYVIYYGKDGKIRKETSWDNWRDKQIDSDEFVNEPVEGFVLNKKAGGYSTGWNHRSTYCRVYDPRGFEFEITIENLLYILENTNSIKGKGLEGKFTYGWDGGDLILIPVESPDYLSIVKYTDLVKNSSIKTSDLVLGGTYKTSQNEQWIYLGRFEVYGDSTYESQKDKYGLPTGLHYYFYNGEFKTLKSISKRFIEIVSQEPCKEYPELMEKLEKQKFYSPPLIFQKMNLLTIPQKKF